jgi:hypothetical protein
MPLSPFCTPEQWSIAIHESLARACRAGKSEHIGILQAAAAMEAKAMSGAAQHATGASPAMEVATPKTNSGSIFVALLAFPFFDLGSTTVCRRCWQRNYTPAVQVQCFHRRPIGGAIQGFKS